MTRSSNSNGDGSDPRAWLEGQVYRPKRKRTASLVRRSVDALLKRGREVSILSIVAMSKELDPDGIGVAHTSILRNPEARAYYEEHRTWKDEPRQQPCATGPDSHAAGEEFPRVEPDRDVERARRRYLQMPKRELVRRILAAEQAYVIHRQLWLQANDELLEWQLRAEAAERKLRD